MEQDRAAKSLFQTLEMTVTKAFSALPLYYFRARQQCSNECVILPAALYCG